MQVLIVGDKPSRFNKSPNVPFIGARCEKRLRSWLDYLGLKWEDCRFVNQSERAWCALHIQVSKDWHIPIIALGNNASKALTGTNHFKLGHPSGLNRKLNSKEYEKKMLDKCKEWLYDYGYIKGV